MLRFGRAKSTPWATWNSAASTRIPRLGCRRAGRLRGGDPYDSSYPKRFLDQEEKEIGIMADWNVSVRESLNRDDKTVDVTLRFDPKAR